MTIRNKSIIYLPLYIASGLALAIMIYAVYCMRDYRNIQKEQEAIVKAYKEYNGEENPEAKATGDETQSESSDEYEDYDLDMVDSILSIPKIDLECPVYYGKNRMDYLEKFMFITGYEDNNYGYGVYYILGHQSRTYGYSFNRLDELENGDTLYIIKEGITYEYMVCDKSQTYEMDISQNKTEKTSELVLYTCIRSKAVNKPYIKVTASLK
jgi:LPXTG-site transpeptidase (sortase) family protein